jgi:outer membrane protein assembly factor BamA
MPSHYQAVSQVVQPSTSLSVDTAAPSGINVQEQSRFIFKALPTLLYDNIEIDHLQYDGWRSKLMVGPIFTDHHVYSATEIEAYFYRILRPNLNLAMRAVVGESTLGSLQSEYFLGGLDTVRGLPDGAIYGSHAAYANLELRHISLRTKYLWAQPAVFVDAGEAGSSWQDAGASARVTSGFGVRLSVPQVYRLVVRIDYGWSLVGPRTHGVTIGMNQFFDPFVPL